MKGGESCDNQSQLKNMNKKAILLTLMSISSIGLVGCSSKDDLESNNSQLLSNAGSKINLSNVKLLKSNPLIIEEQEKGDQAISLSIKGYDRLKILKHDLEYLEDDDYKMARLFIPGYPTSGMHGSFYLDYNSETDSDESKYYMVRKKDRLKEIFKNAKYKDIEGLTYLKGYEPQGLYAKEERVIKIGGEEDFDGEGIHFKTFSEIKNENTLKLMLSMEDKIREVLENILVKEDAEEVIEFLKEEIYRNNDNPNQETNFEVKINDRMYFEYSYHVSNDDKKSTSARFSLRIEGGYEESDEKKDIGIKPRDLKDMISMYSVGKRDDNSHKYYLHPDFDITYLTTEDVNKIYGTDRSKYFQVSDYDEPHFFPVNNVEESVILEEVDNDTWAVKIDTETLDEKFIREQLTPILERMLISNKNIVSPMIDVIIEEMNKFDDDYKSFEIEFEDGYSRIEVSKSGYSSWDRYGKVRLNSLVDEEYTIEIRY